MRVLVLGGTGFMGPHVVARLCDHGCEVAVFNRGQTTADLPHEAQNFVGDRCRLAEYADELRRYAPHVVVDMIPITQQDARDLVTVFSGIAQRLVSISSQDVYRVYGRLIGIESGAPGPLPLTEDAPLRSKLYPYRGEHPREKDDPRQWMDDYDKILVERIVMAAPDLPGTVLRLPMVYGPRDRQHRLFEFLKRMDDNRPAILMEPGLANWRAPRGYVEDMATAIAKTVLDERVKERIYNVAQPDAMSTAEWVGMIGQVTGWQGKVTIVPKESLPQHLVPQMDTDHDFVIDSTRIRHELGYHETTSQTEALKRTVLWERAHPPDEIEAQQFDYAAEDAVLAQL